MADLAACLECVIALHLGTVTFDFRLPAMATHSHFITLYQSVAAELLAHATRLGAQIYSFDWRPGAVSNFTARFVLADNVLASGCSLRQTAICALETAVKFARETGGFAGEVKINSVFTLAPPALVPAVPAFIRVPAPELDDAPALDDVPALDDAPELDGAPELDDAPELALDDAPELDDTPELDDAPTPELGDASGSELGGEPGDEPGDAVVAAPRTRAARASAADAPAIDENWAMQYEQLCDFVALRRRLPTRNERFAGHPVGKWCDNQRQRRRRLSPDRVVLLEQVEGWVWDATDVSWRARLGMLRAFVAEKGRLPAATESTNGWCIGNWCRGQRRKWRLGRLTASKINALGKVKGWWWKKDAPRARP